MSTVIRPAVGDKNPYYISKERYYELKHFCLQYSDYKHRIALEAPKYPLESIIVIRHTNTRSSDPTGLIASNRALYGHYIDMIDHCCQEAGGDICDWIHKAVTLGKSYATLNPPCSKAYFYKRYRKFFWLLDKCR